MRDDEPPHVGRGEDQPPAQADPPCDEQLPQRLPASPTDDRRAASRRRLRRYSATSRDITSSARRLRNVSIRRGNAVSGPPQRNVAVGKRRRCAAPLAAQTRRTSAPSSGIVAPGTNGSAGTARGELRLDPVALVERPGERGAAAGAPRAGQLEHARGARRSAAAAGGRCAIGRISIGTGSSASSAAAQSGALDHMIFKLPGIVLADRPAARRLARLVHRLAAAGDQIMPVAAAARRRRAADRRRFRAASRGRRACRGRASRNRRPASCGCL